MDSLPPFFFQSLVALYLDLPSHYIAVSSIALHISLPFALLLFPRRLCPPLADLAVIFELITTSSTALTATEAPTRLDAAVGLALGGARMEHAALFLGGLQANPLTRRKAAEALLGKFEEVRVGLERFTLGNELGRFTLETS